MQLISDSSINVVAGVPTEQSLVSLLELGGRLGELHGFCSNSPSLTECFAHYRKACSIDAIHAYVFTVTFDILSVQRSIYRPWVAGISPGPDGCYSVALSGGYEDDVDVGEALYVSQPFPPHYGLQRIYHSTYTGSGQY